MIYDILISGAGPVGLFLACELRLAGVSVLVLERSESQSSALKGLPFGMRGLSAPTTDAFYRRGLLEAIVLHPPTKPHAGGVGVVAANEPDAPSRRPGGHFAGIPLPAHRIDPTRWAYRLSTPAAANMPTTMERIETVLTERALSLGVEIRRGMAVEGFTQNGDEIDVNASGEVFSCRWLVGCDGGRSRVRKVGGFTFAGTDPEFTGYSVQVEMADPQLLALGRVYTPNGMYFQSQPGTIAFVEFDGGTSHRAQPLTLEHIQAVLRRVSGVDITLTALLLATTWTDRAAQATRYRNGRVLLAGDAAHIHSPLGGQGLNLGIGDALNLGWKLAAVVRGDAQEALLDTYTAERHPTGAKILDWSRAQVALMRPSPASRALESIIRGLIDTRDGATFFAEQIWGVAVRYDLGDDHPLVGCSAPNFEFADGTKLGERLRGGKGLMLDFDPATPLKTTAARWRKRIDYVSSEVEDALGVAAMLVRPDGVVAWVAGGRHGDLAASAAAAARWFGVA
jgi:2-polyprenyl-6-methoxyphenol hydroxylase-like FAD-dependent oxidoreductase